jgi:NitT/TauT family transport system substrate-binding protein
MDAQTFIDSAAAQKPLIESADASRDGIGMMTTERWQTLIDQLVELKVIEKAPPAAECFQAVTP